MKDDFTPDNDLRGPSEASSEELSEVFEELVRRRVVQDWALPPGAIQGPILQGTVSESGRGAFAGAWPGLSVGDISTCPEPGEWAVLLGGETGAADFERAGELLAHAARCRPCAQRLKMLAADESAEETAALAGRRSTTAGL